MKHFLELRLRERDARKLFASDEGEVIGEGKDIRVVRITREDPRFKKISALEEEYRRSGRSFSFYIGMGLKYSTSELKAAELFEMRISTVIEPAGEELGTVYDESEACPECGAGAPQIGPLRIRLSAVPKKKDFATTIAGEVIISARAVGILHEEKIAGPAYGPVYSGKRSNEPIDSWYQLFAQHTDADIVAPTQIGTTPYDWDRNEYRCSRGDTLGLRYYSELYLHRKGSSHPDFFQTRQFLGLRPKGGVLRPERRFLVSPHFRNVVLSHGLKGCRFEVAHLLAES